MKYRPATKPSNVATQSKPHDERGKGLEEAKEEDEEEEEAEEEEEGGDDDGERENPASDAPSPGRRVPVGVAASPAHSASGGVTESPSKMTPMMTTTMTTTITTKPFSSVTKATPATSTNDQHFPGKSLWRGRSIFKKSGEANVFFFVPPFFHIFCNGGMGLEKENAQLC